MSQTLTTKTFALILLILLFASTASAAEIPDDLVQSAWESNPTLEALQSNIEAAYHKISRAGVWKDPMVAVEYSNVPVDSFELGDHAMSGVQLKIQQTFPFPGKTSKRRAAASIGAQAAEYEYLEKRNQLRAMVKISYWQLAESRALKRMIVEQIDQVQKLIVSVKSRYEIGTSAQHELLKLEVLKDRLEDQTADFQRRDVELTAAINGMLHRAVNTPIQTPDHIEPRAPAKSAASYVDLAKSSRPALLRLSEMTQIGRAAARRAQYEAWPDPTLWAGYRIREEVKNDQGMVMDEGVDFASIGLSIPIPLSYSGGWGAAKKESMASALAAEATQAALYDVIQSDIAKTMAAWRRADQKVANYRESILPGQERAVQATRAAYEVGRASFASLYDSQISLIDIRRALIQAATQTRILDAKMESLVGQALSGNGGKS